MGYTYNTFVTELALLAQFPATDPNFLANLPTCLDYAQNRINRELNLLNTVSTNSSIVTTAGSRIVSLAAINANVLENVNIITPVGSSSPDAGSRNPLVIQNKSWLDWTYGSNVVTGVPEYFSMLDNQTILLGPWPDKGYMVEVIGTYWPIGLTPSNQTTWISTYIPDLLMAAAMIQASGFKMNFGSQADDPKMAISWEDQYTKLRDSAGVEDARRKFFSTGWSSDLPNAYNTARE